MAGKTGLEDYFVVKDQKKMRYGYTTGSCATAASKAAVRMLLSGEKVEEVCLVTPKGIPLRLEILDIHMEGEQVSCAVKKDGGDDPDATNGMLIYSTVSRRADAELKIDGGYGIGRVTLPGLQQEVGEAAINKVPRMMIRENVEEVCEELHYRGGLNVIISAPEGREIAKKTFNPRLGIQGGISILGTSGIVIPMSEAALIESIRVEMKQKKLAGGDYLLMTPGNYGEVFTRDHMHLDMTHSMKCSNFIGETLQIADNLGLKGILFIAHIGKFIKLSGGIMNTHSHHADCRGELMAAAALRAGASLECVNKILDAITTEKALEILKEYGLLEASMKIAVERIMYYLGHQVPTSLELGVILFSNNYGELGRSSNVDELIYKINQQKGE